MSSDWQALGDVQYRKWHIYTMTHKEPAPLSMEPAGSGSAPTTTTGSLNRAEVAKGGGGGSGGRDTCLTDWGSRDINLDNYVVACAPFGGPIAMLRDERKLVAAGRSLSASLLVFSSAGCLLSEIPWENKRLVGMGWSEHENLVCILDDSTVLMYDLHGKFLRTFLILDATATDHVVEAQVWGAGLVALTDDMQLYGVDDLSLAEPCVYTMGNTGLSRTMPATSMAVLQPQFTSSGCVEVILGTRSNSALVVDDSGAEDQQLQERIKAPIAKMSVAPNGRFLACFTAGGILTVLSTSFTTKVLDFDTKASTPPLQMIWCGEDSVVLYWKQLGILMVGPFGDWVRFPYDGALVLSSESDCCRIVTNSTHELLQRVPVSTESIRKIGSTDPAAMLYDAMEAFESGDATSSDIRSIEAASQLPDAVSACITAASAEWDPERQRPLLKAATYGKQFCEGFDSNEFVDTARKLRVLNNVRHPDVGLPLTIQQYDRLTPEVLIDRLIVRWHHQLALKICQYLQLKQDRVLVHWACERLKSSTVQTLSDEALRDQIRMKLKPCGAISYADIASAADHAGRRRLATMLLDYEPHAADQVPLLLSMGEEELALQKAINSADTDLVYMALLYLDRSKTSQESFFRLISNYPEAMNLLKAYYRHKISPTDRSLLHNLLVFRAGRAPQQLEAGTLAVKQAYQQDRIEGRIELMREGCEIMSQSRDLKFQKEATEEQMELLKLQQQLERNTGIQCFVDMSVSETIYNLICLAGTLGQPGCAEQASKIQKQFKVPEKRFWHLKVKALASSGQWQELARFANEKKSPIGYRPFAVACIKEGQPVSETERFIDRVGVAEQRYELYVDVRLWQKAAETAAKMRDGSRLQEVRAACGSIPLQNKIDKWAERL